MNQPHESRFGYVRCIEITESHRRLIIEALRRYAPNSEDLNSSTIVLDPDTIRGIKADEEALLKRCRYSAADGTRPPPVYRGPPIFKKDDLGKSSETMKQNPAAEDPSGTEADGGSVFKKDIGDDPNPAPAAPDLPPTSSAGQV